MPTTPNAEPPKTDAATPTDGIAATAAAAAADAGGRRDVMRPLLGLLAGMFVSILASTVISSSLPFVVSELGGDQRAFTWIVTSMLLATTVSTPIWGKLADLLDRKLLNHAALLVFVAGCVVAGLAQDNAVLIAGRLVQGLGSGGLMALSQVLMADILSPRERGRYMGIFGAVMAAGTVGGPLLGGVVTDTIGWRWNFFLMVPVALATMAVLQATLRLPRLAGGRAVRIDVPGIALLSAGVSLLLVWVTLGGGQFPWLSPASALLLGGALLALLLLVLVVEPRAAEPILPLVLFRERTFMLAVIAAVASGVAMFGTSVFLSQYMQMARGASPTLSGLTTLPMIAGLVLTSVVVGQLISRSGRWKRYMLGGAVALLLGTVLLGTIRYDTPFLWVSVAMFVLGAGLGGLMQNLVLVVQNTASPRDMGAASSGVAFFRSLGGTLDVSAMGTMLGARVAAQFAERAGELQQAVLASGTEGVQAAMALASGVLPQVGNLPEPLRLVVESVFGRAVADTFLVSAPLALVALVAVALLPNVSLSRKTNLERGAEQAAAQPAAAPAP